MGFYILISFLVVGAVSYPKNIAPPKI